MSFLEDPLKNKISEVRILLLFFITTFIFSWLLWIPSILNSNGMQVREFFLFMSIFAIYGPFFSSFLLTGIFYGKTGLKKLLKKGFRIKYDRKVLFFIFGLPLVITFSGFIFSLFINSNLYTESQFLTNPLSVFPLFFIMIFTGGPLGEEFGWRGFALEKLQTKFNAFNSSLILGLVQSFWYLPLFFIIGSTQSYIPIWEFGVLTTTTSFIYTWIYKNSDRSVLAVLLYHNMGNLAAWMFPYWQVALGRYIVFLLNLIVVIYLFKVYGIKKLVKDASEK